MGCRLLKAALYVAIGLVVSSIMLISMFIYRPGVFINNDNLRRIIWLFAPSEASVHWKQLQLQGTAPRLLIHEYKLAGEDVCIVEPRIEGCFSFISAKLRVNYRRWPHIIESVGPIQVNGEKFVISPAKEEKAEKTDLNWEKIYEHAARLKWQPIVLTLDQVIIRNDKTPASLSGIKLKLDRKDEHVWRIVAQLASAKKFPVRRFKVDGTIDVSERAKDKFRFSLAVHGDVQERQFKLRSHGSWQNGAFDATVTGNGINIHPQLARVEIEKCTARGALPVSAKQRLFLNVHCPISAKHNVSLPPSVNIEEWPDALSLIFHGNIDFPHGRNRELSADLAIKTLPLSSPFLKIEAETGVQIRREGGGKNIEIAKWDINVDAKILRFSKLVKALEGSPWAIPAPIRSFQGEVNCKARGGFAVANKVLNIPIACNTDLISSRQEFLSSGEATFRMQKRPSGWQPTVDANIQIQRGQLEVPEIDWRRSLPQLFTDKRIDQGGDSSRTSIKPKFQYTVTLNTTKGSPIKLLSNLARDPVPVELRKLQISSRKPLEGKIVVHGFRLQPLKQLASLDKFIITYTGTGSPALLDGQFDIYNVDYTIRLAVVGTMAKPRIEVFSDPPRPNSELLSAVIFGDASELDSDQMRSVEEARAAIADGAISLISMYYLAATPIDSIGYNPYTGIMRAKIKLSGSTSLTIGSDLRSQQSIGLRRRLSPSWSLETTMQHDSESEEQSERAMLRWAKRY